MTMDLKVDGMTCEGCARAVTKAVQRVDPAATISVDLAAGRVHIEAEGPAARFAAAIAAAGYELPA